MNKIDKKELKKVLELVAIFQKRIEEIAASGETREKEAAVALKQLSEKQLSQIQNYMQ